MTDPEDACLPPLAYSDAECCVWLSASLGRPATDAEVRSLRCRICRAWARRARRVRLRAPEATDSAVSGIVRDEVLADSIALDVLKSPEMTVLLTLAYAALMIQRGLLLLSWDRVWTARAQQDEWARLREERYDLLNYLDSKLSPQTTAPEYCGLPSVLVLAINVGTVPSARAWRDRLAACWATSPAYTRAIRALRADGIEAAEDLRDALAAAPGMSRPELGPPRGLWLSPSERPVDVEVVPSSSSGSRSGLVVAPAPSPVPGGPR